MQKKRILVGAIFVVTALIWFVGKYRSGKYSSPQAHVVSLGNDQFGSSKQKIIISLPEKNGEPSILLFWTTYCGPCKIEMRRLVEAVQSGKIPGQNVYAISVGEDPAVVEDYVLKHEFPFQFFVDEDRQGTKEFIIKGTPTIYHLDGSNHVVWAATGIAPDLIQRAEKLFQ